MAKLMFFHKKKKVLDTDFCCFVVLGIESKDKYFKYTRQVL